MTDILAPTVKTTLDAAQPGALPDALRLLKLGTLLDNIGTAQTKTGTVPATPFQITLDKTPIPGTVRAQTSTAGILQQRLNGALASGQFSVSGKTVTFHSDEEAETYHILYSAIDCGTDGATALANVLDASFEEAAPA